LTPGKKDSMIGERINRSVKEEIREFGDSQLEKFVSAHGSYAIKFVQSKWAADYESPGKLKISETPALTWGTATYVTPIAFPLSSALYGRIGLVTDFDASSWRVFDATTPSGRRAYVRWARAQPIYSDLLLTVHSTQANHLLRNQFRERFHIDCVLFNPDQEAESHTDRVHHVWMAVTDWTRSGTIEHDLSDRLCNARFTVLIDEDFCLQDQGLPIQVADRQIEKVTEQLHLRSPNPPANVRQVRGNPRLSQQIADIYRQGGYLHIYIEP
jgi:hypothetical protein